MRARPWIVSTIVLAAVCVWLGRSNARLRADAGRDPHDPRTLALRGSGVTLDGYDPQPPLAREDDEAGAGMNDAALALAAFYELAAGAPGEDLIAFRARALPIIRSVVDPQRARMTKQREFIEATLELTTAQRAELDAALTDASEQLLGRISQAVLAGELSAQMKPSAGVAVARDLLDVSDQAHQRFVVSLREDQRALLAEERFDVAEYLLIATRWEDLLGVDE